MAAAHPCAKLTHQSTQGNVVGDLNKRKGTITTTETKSDVTNVQAEVHCTQSSS